MDVRTETPAPTTIVRFDPLTRILHWLMVVAIVAVLVLGILLWRQLGDYTWVQTAHQTTGFAVLVLAAVRIVNRLLHRAPTPPLGRAELFLAKGAELAMYALFLAQPLVGWALSSASGVPVRLAYGVRLPGLVSADPQLYLNLRDIHIILAWTLTAIVIAHISAVLFHTVVRRDAVLCGMLPGPTRR